MSTQAADESGPQASEPPGKRQRNKRPLSVSPAKRQELLRNLPGGSCLKCDQELGAESKALQCDLCGSWIHSECESISDETYESLNDALGNLSNVVYYCDSNNCISRIRQILFDFFNQHSSEAKVTSAIQETISKCSSNLYSDLQSKICDINTQMKDLVANNQQLQEQIKTISNSMKDLHKKSYTAAVQSSDFQPPTAQEDAAIPSNFSQSQPPTSDALRNAVSSVINEEKEKQKCKLNLIVHNMSEPSADEPHARKNQDIASLQDILSTHLNVHVHISNAIRLGKKGGPKPRLLKVTVESDEEKAAILRNTKKLRTPTIPEQLKRMYITPDLTPREQEANKALRSELAQRNQSGNQYKIKNGRIVRRRE